MAFDLSRFCGRLGEAGFRGVRATEDPSDDFVQAKWTELLDDPEVTDIKVTCHPCGREPEPPSQGGVPAIGLVDLLKGSLGSPTSVSGSQSNVCFELFDMSQRLFCRFYLSTCCSQGIRLCFLSVILLSDVAGSIDSDWSDDEVEKLKEEGNMKFKVGEYRPAIEVYLARFFFA